MAQNTSDGPRRKRITINDIELRTAPRGKFREARQYLVQFQVDGAPRSTKHAKEKKNCASWDEIFYFDGSEGSVLLAKVYWKSLVGHDQLVGMLADTVGGILGRFKDGVLEASLPKDTSDEKIYPSGITIKFSITTELPSDVNAEKLQAVDAVTKAAEMMNALSPKPQIVDLVDSAIGMGASVVTELQTFEGTWGVLLERMALFNKIVAGIAEIHPYASLAWSVISAANQVLIKQKDRDDCVVRLAGTMSSVFTFVEDADALKAVEAHKQPLMLLIRQVTECGYFIAEYAKQNSFWIRTVKYTLSNIDSKIADYESKLQELKAAFLDGVALQSGVTVFRMMNVVEIIANSIDLGDMPYARGARYVEEKGCLPGTRVAIIRDICDILNNPDQDAPRVCLLTGVAGSGKSAVAHSIARLYDGQKRLGSSYCFLRSDVTRRNPQNFFSTIALDLSDHDLQYKAELCRIVTDNRSLRTSASLLEQVRRLVIEPSKNLHTIGPLIIVVDALDESGDQPNRRSFLRALSEQITEDTLPTNLRFLITARPEIDILSALASSPRVIHKQLGDIPEDVVDEDIGRFIHHSLHQYIELETTWPNQVWCRHLVRHSQHLFQWASTACRFIEGDGAVGLDIPERLKILIRRNDDVAIHPLDELYRTILGQLFTLEHTQQRFRDAMAFVLALKEPLSLTALTTLFDGRSNIRDIIKPMGALLDGAHNERKPVRPLHTSFRDFLLDDARSSIFHVIVSPRHYSALGHASLGCMRKMLRFNMCDLEDSRRRNSAVPNIKSRVMTAVPPYLAYACQYWMDHLQHAECSPALLDEVTAFFQKFFPFWIEAISLLSLTDPLSCTLSALTSCLTLAQWAKDHEVALLATDASKFIQLFAPVLRESTPHLYLSAMPQTPSSSPLCQLWASHLQSPLSVTLGYPTSWPAEVHVLHGHTDHVLSVAYSPDGSQIASGALDKTIRVWSSITGECMAVLPQLHTGMVLSVSYSPDGSYIVSGSKDKTIRVWDASTGQHIAGPFLGHTGSITCVIFSPDGCHIASASNNTIRILDADTGHTIGELEGHKSTIESLAFSPDGTHIVSGSHDDTLRIWDVSMGTCVTGPLKGHTLWVHSVAYSPDCCHVASGGGDKTVRVWDAVTGKCILGPLKGHFDRVNSIAYSPDGNLIVSASSDLTLRLWDVHTGQCIAGPYWGHTRVITSVAYSPHGNCILSGSWDGTVRVRDAITSHQEDNTLPGHSRIITAVAFSPDGGSIASGSYDCSIKIWDAKTGQHISSPFDEGVGTGATVSSIAFSPDGNHIIFGVANSILFWNRSTSQYLVGSASQDTKHMDLVLSVACSPDGKYAASASADRSIMIWDALTAQHVAGPFREHTSWVFSIGYSPDGNHLVSGSLDNTIRIWDPITGECVAGPFCEHTGGVECVAYSPDGKHIVSCSRDMTIRIWDPTTGECVADPFLGHTDQVLSVAYSPDGCHIVSGSEDKTIRIWDASTGQCIAGPFEGHTGPIQSVAYSPDGNHIVSGSADQCVKVWASQDLLSFGEMRYQESGWIKLSNDTLFFWIPPWGRHAFCLPVHTVAISSYRSYQLDTSHFPCGESWISCWK